MSRVPLLVIGLALSATALTSTTGRAAAPHPVVTHHAGGSRTAAHLRPTVQVIRTTHEAGEPTLGFDRRGRAWFVGLQAQQLAGHGAFAQLYSVAPDGTGIRDHSWRTSDQDTQPSLDPYVYADPRTGRVFDVELQGRCSTLRWTDDQGATFSTSVAGCTLSDHQSVFAGPAPASGPAPKGYPNVVYYCAIADGALSQYSAGVGCERSLDGGQTWGPTGEQAFTLTAECASAVWFYEAGCDGVAGQGVVAPDGTVLVPKVLNGRPMLARSLDEGATWERTTVDTHRASTDTNGYADGQSSVAVDRTGVVYYAWMARDRQPTLAVSRDGGRTFGRPQKVGIPGLRQAWHVAIDAQGRGKVAVHYIGSEDAPRAPFPDDSTCRSDEGLAQDTQAFAYCPYDPEPAYRRATWNAYLGITVDALSRQPVWYSTRANPAGDPLVVGQCLSLRCQQQFDFTDVHISPYDGSAWAVYVDGCTPDKQCTATGAAQLVRMSGVDLRK